MDAVMRAAFRRTRRDFEGGFSTKAMELLKVSFYYCCLYEK